ncbi:segregation/condensation protein A [Streptomyces sp. NPDC050848]|uniref:segregation and condensation protein A n=1 Tax=Streptomyces sp. NPDC050848 TaxID=3155791 RepID=UPI0033C43906
MPPPPAETSRPPRRRALGKGPGAGAPPSGGPEAPGPPPEEPTQAAEAPEAVEPSEAPDAVESTEPSAMPPAPEPLPAEGEAPAVAGVGPGLPGEALEPEGVISDGSAAAGAEPEPSAPGPVDGLPGAAGGSLPVPDAAPPADAGAPPGDDGRFTVRLANFEGPFDLLLQLISKHKLDVTEVALSKVTDEFMAHIRAMGPDWDLDQTTEFLVVAATLLDLKAARLLPAAEVEDEADLALLEARDLLFARLLQYRAYKQIAEIFGERWETEGRRHPRTVGLEAHHAELLPEVVISIGAEGFAKLAVKAMQPRAKPQVYVDHIHAPLVSVREQAGLVVALLRERGSVSFRELAEDAPDTLTVVARFLALLELYREKAVALDQDDALGELTVTWTGGNQDTHVTDEFDQPVEEKA